MLLLVLFPLSLGYPLVQEMESNLDFNISDTKAEISQAIKRIQGLKHGKSHTFNALTSFALGGLIAALDFVEEVINEEMSTETVLTTETSRLDPTTVYFVPSDTAIPDLTNDSINEIDSDRVRLTRDGEPDYAKNDTAKGREDDDDDDGDGGGLIGAIVSGFLGSLSKPDGGVDVNAVVGVIGSLSAMQEDGSYDFSGLTDTLSAFFGGGDEDGGGSDVGSFIGGLAAAAIAGITSPPGAKGAGRLVGNLLKQVLPALSAPEPAADGSKPQQSGAGGFLFTLINSIFGTPPDANVSKNIKSNIINLLFSTISSILGSSSSASKG
ncbi:hypothetical protein RI129_007055 [Pyrocoelia pectoralis]|uniref:Uncharacterized protein n=1 Tax=Pyrocoelia pectoralis TaxID=417401 RepID=A0AAN7V798_9COLE